MIQQDLVPTLPNSFTQNKRGKHQKEGLELQLGFSSATFFLYPEFIQNHVGNWESGRISQAVYAMQITHQTSGLSKPVQTKTGY